MPTAECRVLVPPNLTTAVEEGRGATSLIARGNGRAYGDAALNRDATLSTLRLDRLRGFDPATGVLTVEAGLLLADLLAIFVPKGWFPPVTPGTRFVTLGGMLAADVHGKNHHCDGGFAAHVLAFELMCGDGEIRTCSRQENTALFDATIGGMGLTGLILTLTLRLRRIETAWMVQETLRCRDLDETLAAFVASQSWTYSVAWIDCLARGRERGRALLYRGEHAGRADSLDGRLVPGAAPGPKRGLGIPVDLPGWVLNGTAMAGFNALYYRRARPGSTFVDFETFFYPLDAIASWNRIYGRRGFLQYQCVVPLEEGRDALLALLKITADARAGSFLAVLKEFGAQGSGLLSFPMPGYTLALDFPASREIFAMLPELDRIVAACGGRIYLAKDARMGADLMGRSYPGLARFRDICADVDPDRRFRSLLSERLNLR
jgi:decaprenylphospho-beta-D-ribofuranose 2-oxidase